MGGPGSGNSYHWWRGPKKEVVEVCKSLDVNLWMRKGLLKPGADSTGAWTWTYGDGRSFAINYRVDISDPSNASVRLWYSWVWTATQQQESANYSVELTSTRPRFGGLRWWFICPLIVNGRVCRRRVGKLYLPPSGRYFGCRQCHSLTYTSCQDSHKFDGLWQSIAANTGTDFATVRRMMNRLAKGPSP
jgi:hypothetical protein